MTREELFDHYVAETLDNEGTAELGELLAGDPEFAAEFARDLVETGLFVQVGDALQRVAEPAASPDAPSPEAHPHLVTGDLPQGPPRFLKSLRLTAPSQTSPPPPPPPAPPSSSPPAPQSPPPPAVQNPVSVAQDPVAVAQGPVAVAQGPVPAGQDPGVQGSIPGTGVSAHHPQPVLKSAQRGVPVAVYVILAILAVGISVAVLIGLNRKPPPVAVDPVIARIEMAEGALVLRRGPVEEKIGVGKDLLAGDQISVRKGGARVAYIEEASWLHLLPGCNLRFEEHDSGKNLRLDSGRMTAEIGPQPVGRPVVIRTPQATIRVLGTALTIRVDARQTEVEVASGRAVVERNADRASVGLSEGLWTIVGGEGPLTSWELLAGVNLGGDAVEIGGKKWLSYGEAQSKGLVVKGLGGEVESKRAQCQPLGPLSDKALNSVLMTGLTCKGGRLSLTWPLPDGRYQIMVWIMEDQGERARSLRLNLEEKSAAKELGKDQTLGAWNRFGPYPVTVDDGNLDLLLSADLKCQICDPHLMGFAVYRVAGS